ncbi:hypothetical protein M066_2265 [Bacteroides fragilis str. I1345]|nr:hypothetical protein M080_2009 [Bacteroides fragilis str. 3397 T10]EXY95533.1 hypothetical protein M081_2323 [Bacteroides fragilis str. 3998 T(B) 4]EXZ19323.1 hypothetical protein M067_2288 [Bacteroides fragilis str. J-143-4]EXZ50265.1 hypothetical protein M109_0878 [Bacteroides fragilis str. 3397 N2]EXZ67838.1 hypothetical protein M120_2483 [Bacteroides fragilis str. 3783N1-8]EXZ94619.1 hypothetical protein M065_3015 [Bacteroides fragilis str. Korea 419]EYA43652.1 hypothetical protein M11
MVYIRFHHEPYVAHTDPDKRIETGKYHCRLPQPLCNGCNHKILK